MREADGPRAGGRNQGRKVRLYDFRRPDKFSKEQIRTLEMIHDNFGRLLSTNFSAHFRAMTQVSVQEIQQKTYAEFIDALSDPSIMGILSLSPLEGNAIMEIDAQIAFPIIDRLFGGPGYALSEPRSLTDLEGVVMQRVFRTALGSLVDAWAHVLEVKTNLEAIEANPLFVQIVPPNDIVLVIRFYARIGEHHGTIQLCLPFLLLEPVLPKLSAHQWFSRERKSSRQSEVEQHLNRLTVNMWARLGVAGLTVGELMDLKVGDVIRLGTAWSGDLDVFVEDQVRFKARPGRVGEKLAVSITGVADDEEVKRGE